MNKHIFFILDYFYPHRGGVETVFDNIINRLLVKGYKITILTSRFSEKLKKYENINGIEIYRAGKSRTKFIRGGFRAGYKILKNNKDISIIHTSTYGGAIPASILGKIFQKKIVLTVHEIFGKLWNVYKGKFKGFFYRLFEKIIFSLKYDIYHCVSRYTMNSLRIAYNIPDEKIKVIQNGVDTDFWNQKNINKDKIIEFKKKYGLNNNFVLLYSGHSGKSKGLEYLIKAVPELIKKYDDIIIVFNLIHAKRDSITRYSLLGLETIVSKNQKEHIKILNGFPKEELINLVASCDLAVAPSLSEGFGSIHTETVALGRPLITTFVGPLPEVLWGKVEFIPPKSSQDIVKAVIKFREEGFENLPIKIFSWEDTIIKIEFLYNKLY